MIPQNNTIAILYSKPVQYVTLLICVIAVTVFFGYYFQLNRKDLQQIKNRIKKD